MRMRIMRGIIMTSKITIVIIVISIITLYDS